MPFPVAFMSPVSPRTGAFAASRIPAFTGSRPVASRVPCLFHLFHTLSGGRNLPEMRRVTAMVTVPETGPAAPEKQPG